MSSFGCDKCGKECKDKRGLAIHYNKCGIDKRFICEFCNQEFSTSFNLSSHTSRCKTMKTRKELMSKEEIDILKAENSKLKNETLNHQKELLDLKTSLKKEYEQQLKIRDNDIFSYHKEVNDLSKELKDKEQKLEEISEANKTLQVDNRTLLNTVSTLSLKDTTTTIINQPSFNDNRIQLQSFDPSMIQGRIQPPGYVIGNVDDLVRMLRSLGVRNCFRVNDKSRGTISWHKPGEGEIRDPNAEQFLTHVIDSLNSDLIKEKSYYEEELKALYNADDQDLYQIDESRGFVNFCSELLKKKPETLKKIKRELIKQGKSKNDSEVDQVQEVTYTKFVTSIIVALFPQMTEWIDNPFYEIGRLLGTKTRDYYHTEGSSREKLYIVIHSDHNTNKKIDSKKMMSYISEALESVIDSELIERILEDILIKNKDLNSEQVQEVLKYMKNPTLPETKEIMRGIVSL